ncbi:MAG TPA: hypothetical protein VFE30_10020, partial [Anaeromyxobacteraceae bacterium]|nr:hypothetical protein [Anaeromyxobacteraceae bacterium]
MAKGREVIRGFAGERVPIQFIRISSSITSLARLPPELHQEKRVVATSEHQPPRGTVVLDMTAERGDS